MAGRRRVISRSTSHVSTEIWLTNSAAMVALSSPQSAADKLGTGDHYPHRRGFIILSTRGVGSLRSLPENTRVCTHSVNIMLNDGAPPRGRTKKHEPIRHNPEVGIMAAHVSSPPIPGTI